MFAFFKRKKTEITVEVETWEESRFAAGLQTVSTKRGYVTDIKKLQKRFYELRGTLVQRSNPSGTLVVFHNTDPNGCFRYFVGDLVDTAAQPEDLTIFELAPGDYADIHVKFSSNSGLSLNIAKAKQYFIETWLPASGYRVKGDVESMELYDQRSNIQLPSIELIFPLQKID